MLDLSKLLVHCLDRIWAAQQQAQYLRAGDVTASPSSFSSADKVS